jgi:hypothetical protein
VTGIRAQLQQNMSAQREEISISSDSEENPVVTYERDLKEEEILRLWDDMDYQPDMSIFEGAAQLPTHKPKKYWKQFEIGRSGLPKHFEKMVGHNTDLVGKLQKVCAPENLRLCAPSKAFRTAYAKMQAICIFRNSVKRRYNYHIPKHVDELDDTRFENKKFEVYLRECAKIVDKIKSKA